MRPYNLGNLWRRLVPPDEIDQPSLKFDNKIGGVAWIDDVELEPITGGL